MNKLSIVEVSDLVFPYSSYGNTGRVHSLFSNSLNVVVGNQLLHISGKKNFLSPFGLRLQASDFQFLRNHVSKDDLVILKEDFLTVYSLQRPISLIHKDASLIKKQKLYPLNDHQEEIETVLIDLERRLEKKEIGIAEDELFLAAQTKLLAGKLEDALPYLVGRGLGLTPSGDDMLIGYIIGCLLFTDLPILERVEKYRKYFTRQTTIVSTAYLTALLKRRVSSPLFSLVESLSKKECESILSSIREIEKVGHTSGRDTLFGLLLSLKFINNHYEK